MLMLMVVGVGMVGGWLGAVWWRGGARSSGVRPAACCWLVGWAASRWLLLPGWW